MKKQHNLRMHTKHKSEYHFKILKTVKADQEILIPGINSITGFGSAGDQT
jgi:hypothetical protein